MSEAPERRNAWNVRLEFWRFSLESRDLKWRLTWLSVRGSHVVEVLYWNKGEVLEPGVILSRFLMALTGQMGLDPRAGIIRILTDFLSWMVLLHFKYNVSSG